MARKQIKFLILDCETATLPFANEIAMGDAEKKKRIAIARPLIYDIGWTITNRKGEILDKKTFLIAETFSVPSVFNTAYYADKRPLYIEALNKQETTIKPWREVAEILVKDMNEVDSVGAYNSMFDFKKAIPFTELYINKLYSDNYYEWEQIQRKLCRKIANEPYKKDDEKEFDPNTFLFRENSYDLFDIWGLATRHLLNSANYKKQCLKNNMLTASGTFFKTSAESSYRYLVNKYDFNEAHTALDDAIIETFILSKIAARHSITIGIIYFPFRDLGNTYDFVKRRKKPDGEEVNTVIEAIEKYLEGKDESTYTAHLNNVLEELRRYLA